MLDDLPSPAILTLHVETYKLGEFAPRIEIKQTVRAPNVIDALRTAILAGTGSQTAAIDWLAGAVSKMYASGAPTPKEREAADALIAAAIRYCQAIAQQETQGTT